MANLTELSQYDAGVYQIETTDPVLGGTDGIANAQGKALANRTKWLKEQVDALGDGKQPLDATLTALAALVTSANKMIYSTGADTFSLADLTAFARTLLDDADAAAARTTLGVDTAIAAAVAALVNSSPSTLDTLNELAAALGNDPNFATTVTNAIAAKAGLASPTFTGNPAGPTPSQFDNDTSLATTAFVQRAIGNNAGVDSVNSATSLSAVHAGRLIVASGAGGFTITLPSAGAVITGCSVDFFNGSGSDVTVARNSSDLIWVNTNGYNLENIKIGSGDTLRLVSNGSNGWMVSGGTGAQDYARRFACRAWVNFNGTGTVAIRASGNVSSITDNGTGSYTVNFTTAMVDANYNCVATSNEGAPGSATGVVARLYNTASITSQSIETINFAATRFDGTEICAAIFR